jgi:histidine transport system permease protein
MNKLCLILSIAVSVMMNIEVVLPYLPRILQGFVLTIELSLLSLFFALVLGLLGALMKTSASRLLRFSAASYSTIVRGVPELVWILFVFYGLQMGINALADNWGVSAIEINPFLAGTLTLAFIFGAYFTETFRGAILAIPAAQIETGLAYGMTPAQVFQRITFPQLMRYALPGIKNNWLVLTKATALASVIGLDDMVRVAKQAGQAQGQAFLFNVISASLFLLMTSVSLIVFHALEQRYQRGIKGYQDGH